MRIDEAPVEVELAFNRRLNDLRTMLESRLETRIAKYSNLDSTDPNDKLKFKNTLIGEVEKFMDDIQNGLI